MDKPRCYKYAELLCNRFKQTLATDYNFESTGAEISDHNPEDHRGNLSHRHGFHVQSVKYLLVALNIFSAPIYANEVGGVSATATQWPTPGVVQQAIQVLQGPYITNTYGNAVQCGVYLEHPPFVTL